MQINEDKWLSKNPPGHRALLRCQGEHKTTNESRCMAERYIFYIPIYFCVTTKHNQSCGKIFMESALQSKFGGAFFFLYSSGLNFLYSLDVTRLLADLAVIQLILLTKVTCATEEGPKDFQTFNSAQEGMLILNTNAYLKGKRHYHSFSCTELIQLMRGHKKSCFDTIF